MAKIREVLIHVSVETASGRRKCARKPGVHSIAKGESCLVVKGGEYNAPKSYCRECAAPILDKAERQLSDMKSELFQQ